MLKIEEKTYMNDISELKEDFKEFRKENSEFVCEVRAYMARQMESCINHKDKTERLDKVINGNGKPGMCKDLEELKYSHNLIKYVSGIAFGGMMTIALKAAWDAYQAASSLIK